MSDKYAIVAEYRSVALLEKAGTVSRFWQGKEYFTDGKTYLFFKTDTAERMGLWAFHNERDAKVFIDSYHDEEIPDSFQKPLLNYKEMYQVLHQKPHVGEVPVYIFNEETGVFTFFNGVRDGQHRHKGIK